jgi:hypothetical protein
MFTKLRMTNFKSWRDTGEVKLAPLTAFFGTNSSGKSSLLQMLLLLKQTAESNDRNLVLKTGNVQEGYVNLGTAQEIAHRDTQDFSLAVAWQLADRLEIPIPETETTLPITKLDFYTAIHAEAHSVYVTELSYQQHNDFRASLKRSNNQYSMELEVAGKKPKRPQARPILKGIKPQKCYGFSDEALRSYQNSDYLSDIVLSLEQQFQRLYYLGPLRDYPQRIYSWGGEAPSDVGLKGELAIAALLAGKSKRVYEGRGKAIKLEQKIAECLVEMGLAHSFVTKPLVDGGIQYQVKLRRSESSAEVLITDMGFGVSQVLPVLVLCYYAPPGSTLIFEQPEIHLHPSVQQALADVFIDVVNKRNIQIIIESHSEHLLRRLQRRIAEKELKPHKTALYFCDLEAQESTIQPLDADMFGRIRNWPKDFFGDMAGDLVATVEAGLEAMSNGHTQR